MIPTKDGPRPLYKALHPSSVAIRLLVSLIKAAAQRTYRIRYIVSTNWYSPPETPVRVDAPAADLTDSGA